MTPRRFAVRLEKLPFVVALSSKLADWRANRWLKANPGRTFADYYVARNEQRIAAGRPHPTLGSTGYSPVEKRATAWTGSSFRTRGLDHWAVFRAQGLEAGMRTVDYGCGSLRLGQHAIAYLDPQRYCGVDPSPRFIAEGMALLDPALVAAKQPWVDCLDDETVAKIHEWRPQFVFSNAVLQHVPPSELRSYFDRLGEMMAPGCIAVIMFVAALRLKRIKAMSWAHSESLLSEVAGQSIADATIEFAALPKGHEGLSGGGRRLMILRRSADGPGAPADIGHVYS